MTSVNESSLPELLCPAGSPAALSAALEAGADAVYFGMPDFNARIGADNFTAESFEEAVKLCHLYGAKAYITLNTQIYDRETNDFLDTAALAYRLGADAAIVGDLGAAALIRGRVPGLALHASTQLSGHRSYAGAGLSKLGFSRMVCARETSLGDIKEFVKDSPIEAEIFIHGALCVCHSGQCLFSSLVGGRSGNRGLCAQPCRLPYRVGKGTGYPLSLKDMCLASHIPEIIDSGVASLKIEGRMKPAEYVGGVTAIYRRLLDERRAATKDELDRLTKIFSRGGFTSRYFTGSVAGVSASDMLGVRSEKDKEASRNADVAYEPKKIKLSMRAVIKRGEPMVLNVSVDPGDAERYRSDAVTAACVSGEVPLEAINRPTDRETIEKNLSKLGGTVFTAWKLEIELDEGLMIPLSAVNALRRDAIDALSRGLLAPYECRKSAKIPGGFGFPEKLGGARVQKKIGVFREVSQIPAEAKNYFDEIYLPAAAFGAGADPAAIRAAGVNGVALPPAIFDSETEAVGKLLDSAKSLGIVHALVGNVGHIPLALGRGFTMHGGFRLNISNSVSAREALSLGFADVTLSPELTAPMARDVCARSQARVIVYGRIPLMVLEKCVIREISNCEVCRAGRAVLTDRQGVSFPVLREFDHRSVIYNSLPTYMADKSSELSAIGGDGQVFVFTVETSAEVRGVIGAYKKGAPAGYAVRRMGIVTPKNKK